MALNRIWVYAEAADGKVHPLTLELLAKARTLGGEVTAVFGGDGATVAEELGAHGATKVLATGDLGQNMPGVAIASAIAGAGQTPDLFLLGTTYEGRDVAARLSVKLDKPVLTNNTEIAVDGDAVKVTTLRLRHKGMPDVSGRGRGDLFATVQVQTPKKLNKEQRALLEQLAKALPNEKFEPRPPGEEDERNLFDRVKNMFG